MRNFNNILITGGCGFIGSNLIHFLFEESNFSGRIINLDKLTYAGNPLNLSNLTTAHKQRYSFVHGDICDSVVVQKIFDMHKIDCIIHLAAESHVDRSIYGPADFVETNIHGTFCLLEVARKNWVNRRDVLFYHVSTDEVYGSLGDTGYFTEETPYSPRSPYSASKAASDHLVKAYFHTYDFPILMSNCSNNYGPYQFPEKLIPLMILNMLEGRPLPVYGDGKNVRDWLYVKDHCSAIWSILQKGRLGETYNVGGENEWENLKLVETLCEVVATKMNRSKDEYKKLINFVVDRKGHDRRYAIDCSKIKKELAWTQSITFEKGLFKTVEWYLNSREWIESIRTGTYKEWILKNYDAR